MSQILATLRNALAALEAELLADPRYREMARIKAAMEAYEPGSTSVSKAANANDAIKTPAVERTYSPRSNSRAERIRQELQAWFTATGPHNNHEVRDHLVASGLLGEDSQPSKETSTHLWRGKEKKIFVRTKDGRWTVPTSKESGHGD